MEIHSKLDKQGFFVDKHSYLMSLKIKNDYFCRRIKMSSMFGILIIICFYLLGQIIGRITGDFIPGSIIGMILLFIALSCHIIKPHYLRQSVHFLMNNMILFFIPVGVGLMNSYDLLLDNMLAIIAASLISTVLVIIVVGRMAQKMEKKRNDE